MGDTGRVLAADLRPGRARRVAEAARRLGLTSVHTVVADGLAPPVVPVASTGSCSTRRARDWASCAGGPNPAGASSPMTWPGPPPSSASCWRPPCPPCAPVASWPTACAP